MQDDRRGRKCGPLCSILIGLTFIFLIPHLCLAYGVFTHQQLIDLAWDNSIRPLLLSRFPQTTPAELRIAHAYAYGGCVVQDLGYYPFGHEFFSNLTHYVRSGDFVLSLFRHARNVNEYAFAVGALSHYVGDSIGHREAVNLATAIAFSKLRKKYGPIVTYQDSPSAHIRTEFGFDVDQLAGHRVAPQRYLDYIGFRVAGRLLRVAFRETYGLELRQVLGPEYPALHSYRSSVRHFIPLFGYAEVVIHKHHFKQDTWDEEFELYLNRLARIDYEKQFATRYQNPGIGAHLIAILIPILPRIGALSYLAIKDPTPETEQLYVHSVNVAVDDFSRHLHNLGEHPAGTIDLPNRDLDTGDVVRPGAYRLTDDTYARLLDRITSGPGRAVRPGIKRDVLAYYADPDAPITTKKHKATWRRVKSQLVLLRQMPVAPATIVLEP